jgi:hypothetical protein
MLAERQSTWRSAGAHKHWCCKAINMVLLRSTRSEDTCQNHFPSKTIPTYFIFVQRPSVHGYSYFSACKGSTFVALRAGI